MINKMKDLEFIYYIIMFVIACFVLFSYGPSDWDNLRRYQSDYLTDAYVFSDSCSEIISSSTNKLSETEIDDLCESLGDLSKKESEEIIQYVPEDDEPDKSCDNRGCYYE